MLAVGFFVGTRERRLESTRALAQCCGGTAIRPTNLHDVLQCYESDAAAPQGLPNRNRLLAEMVPSEVSDYGD